MEKDTINQRIIQAINYLLEQRIVLRKSELAEKLSCSPQTVTEILGGRQGVKVDMLQRFFDIFNVSYDFIFKGEGPVLNASMRIRPKIAGEPMPIPMVDISVAAGSGFYNDILVSEQECISLPEYMLKSGSEYLCVRIKGASMVPTLQDGGYLIVRMLDPSEWRNIRDNHIYIITDREGRAFVKRLKNRLQERGIIVCVSDNPDKIAFPNFDLMGDEINTIWYAEWYFTSKMPNIHETYYNKVDQLEENYNTLREELGKLRNEYLGKKG